MSRMGAESCRFSSRMDGKRMENRKQIRKAKLPTGIDDFQKIRTNNYYYVDKTAVIEQVLENGSEVTLFTRPRRFGKSLNMSMMQCFFEAGQMQVSLKIYILQKTRNYVNNIWVSIR